MPAQYQATEPTRQGIQIFTVLTGITVIGILAWHFIRLLVNASAPSQDFILIAALFGVFLGGIYPGFLGKQRLGGLVTTWICASLPLAVFLGLTTAYLIWIS